MPKNLIVRVGLDPSGYNNGMDKMAQKAETTSKRISKAMGNTTLSQRVGKAMGWSGNVSDAITEVNAGNIDAARQQLADLTAYKSQLQGLGFNDNTTDAQYGEVSERIRELTYDIKEYEAELQRQSEAQRAAAQSAQTSGHEVAAASREAASAHREEAEAAEDATGSTRRSIQPLRSIGQWLRSIGSHVPGIRKTSDHIRNLGTHSRASNLDIGRMVRSLRNVALVSFGFRIAGAALGRLRSIVSEYISENATLQAQVNGLKQGMGQALAPAINLVTNAMSALMPYILGISNAIGQLMGALFGSGWTTAANGAQKTAAATGSAAKAQKEMNRQLLSFDEINKLSDNSSSDSGSGGGGGSGSNITPIESKTPAWLERFKQSFSDLFNSDEFKAANIGGKIGMVLQTGLDWLGNEGKAFDWRGVGTKLRENWDSFLESGWVDSLFSTLGIYAGGFADAVIGFLEPEWEQLKKHYEENGAAGAAAYIGSLILGIPGSLAEFVYDHVFGSFFSGIGEYFREKGDDSVADFFDGVGTAFSDCGTWLEENFSTLLIDSFFSSLGLNFPMSPFTSAGRETIKQFLSGMGDVISNIGTWFEKNSTFLIDSFFSSLGLNFPMSPFTSAGREMIGQFIDGAADKFNSVTEKLGELRDDVFSIANRIKEAFDFEWNLPTLRLPHLNVEWDPVDNVLANFFGVTAFPRLSVSWFAKGGILDGAQIFGRMGSTLLGGGEYGREAVLPLDHNTGWMDTLAQRVVSMLSGQTGGDINLTIPVTLDGKEITRIVIKGLREYARANGGLAF